MSLTRKQTGKAKGLYNSSITRVRPVFQQLLHKDPTGATWLTDLLDLAPRKAKSRSDAIAKPGILLEEVSKTRRYSDYILRGFGLEQPIDLGNCFEKSLPPPEKFLKWLIQNLGRLIEPGDKRLKYLTDNRKDLFDTNRPEAQRAAIAAGLNLLNTLKARGSARQWWAFEGFTEVDCYLETDTLVLLIEGKRTERLSAATLWFPKRQQIVRNLEVAAEIARQKRKDFAVLLIAEDIIDFNLADELVLGLPHLDANALLELDEHYLGCITWQALCKQTGLDFRALPNTSKEIAEYLYRELYCASNQNPIY